MALVYAKKTLENGNKKNLTCAAAALGCGFLFFRSWGFGLLPRREKVRLKNRNMAAPDFTLYHPIFLNGQKFKFWSRTNIKK